MLKNKPMYRTKAYVELVVLASGRTPSTIKKWMVRRGMTVTNPEDVITTVLYFLEDEGTRAIVVKKKEEVALK